MSRKGKIIIYVSIAILIALIGIVIGYFCVKNLGDNENSNPVESPVEIDEEIEINDPIESNDESVPNNNDDTGNELLEQESSQSNEKNNSVSSSNSNTNSSNNNSSNNSVNNQPQTSNNSSANTGNTNSNSSNNQTTQENNSTSEEQLITWDSIDFSAGVSSLSSEEKNFLLSYAKQQISDFELDFLTLSQCENAGKEWEQYGWMYSCIVVNTPNPNIQLTSLTIETKDIFCDNNWTGSHVYDWKSEKIGNVAFLRKKGYSCTNISIDIY